MMTGFKRMMGQDEETYIPFGKLVEKYGLKFGKHPVKTADGYTLEVFNVRDP